MRYAGIIKNDFTAAPGVSVTFFAQGCPHHCKGCHNPETWDFNGGKGFCFPVVQEVIMALRANGVKRNLCIQGGEPLCKDNLYMIYSLITEVRWVYPDTKIYIWTGYLYEDLLKSESLLLQSILSQTDVLIDGPYVEELRDITLPMRGSSNQKIIDLQKKI